MKATAHRVIILLGPPGSGKGTQATLLAKKLHLPHISTGDILREEINKKTPLGQHVKTWIERGEFISDDVIVNIILKRISQTDCDRGYIFDGFPRTLPQAQALDKQLIKKTHICVFNFEISDDKIIERLTQRVICSHCKTIYHLIYSPPSHPGICNRCQTRLIQRGDDTESVIKQRLHIYHKQTAPLIAFYSKHYELYTIQCDRPIQEIEEKVLSYL